MTVVLLLPIVFKLDQWHGDKAARVNEEIFAANSQVRMRGIEPSSKS